MITAHQNQIIIEDLYVSFQRDDDHRTSESDNYRGSLCRSREMMITAHQNQIIIDDLYVSFQRDDDHRTSESDR